MCEVWTQLTNYTQYTHHATDLLLTLERDRYLTVLPSQSPWIITSYCAAFLATLNINLDLKNRGTRRVVKA